MKRVWVFSIVAVLCVVGCQKPAGYLSSKEEPQDPGGGLPQSGAGGVSPDTTMPSPHGDGPMKGAVRGKDEPNQPPKQDSKPTTVGTVGVPSGSSGASARGMGMQRPPLPPADETANLQFDSGSSTVEVIGVCKVTEEGASCWKPDGRPDKELSSAMESQLHSNMGPTTFRFKRKNRFVVVRETRKVSSDGPSAYIQYQGDPFLSGSTIYLKNDGVYSNAPVDIKAHSLAVDSDSTEGRVRFLVSTPIAHPPIINLRVGESITFNGITAKIKSIGLRKAPEYSMPREKQKS